MPVLREPLGLLEDSRTTGTFDNLCSPVCKTNSKYEKEKEKKNSLT